MSNFGGGDAATVAAVAGATTAGLVVGKTLSGWVAKNLLVMAALPFPPRDGKIEENDLDPRHHRNDRSGRSNNNRRRNNIVGSNSKIIPAEGRMKKRHNLFTFWKSEAGSDNSDNIPARKTSRKGTLFLHPSSLGPASGEKNTMITTSHSTIQSSSHLTAVAVMAGVVVYVLYPTSILLAFRISELIAWVNLFQHYHACRMGSSILSHCVPLGIIQLSQLATTVGTIWYFVGLFRRPGRGGNGRSIWTGMVAYLLVCSLMIGIVKFNVDHSALYQPPQTIFDVTPVATSSQQQFLYGKVAVVTGANRGIGFATAKWLACNGATVILTCRSIAKCQPAVDTINSEILHNRHKLGSAIGAVLDLSSLQSSMDFVDYLHLHHGGEYAEGVEVEQEEDVSRTVVTSEQNVSSTGRRKGGGIHYIFANAGTTPQYHLTQDGFEDGFGGMHLNHMAVVLGSLPLLTRGAQSTGTDSRIVMVSSEMSINAAMGILGDLDDMFDVSNLRGERMRGDGRLAKSMPAYGRAKLCNVLFALELNRRLAVGGRVGNIEREQRWPIIAHAVHTGAVVTDSSRNSIKKTFEGIFPGLSWLVGNVYFPMLWRNVKGGARTLLCAALSDQDYVVRGGQYLDSLCHAFLPTSTTERDYTPENKIRIPIGKGRSMSVFLDPVQALLVADVKYSRWLWDVSLDILTESPARDVVKNAQLLP